MTLIVPIIYVIFPMVQVGNTRTLLK